MKSLGVFLISFLLTTCERVEDAEFNFLLATWTQEDMARSLNLKFRRDEHDEVKLQLSSSLDDQFEEVQGERKSITGTTNTYWSFDLENLTPGQIYFFTFVVDGFPTPKRWFRALDPNQEVVQFVDGGDTGISLDTNELFRLAGDREPDFFLIGGDIAYADGKVENWEKWQKWLEIYERHSIRPSGRIIPLIAAIGNHEVNHPLLAFPKYAAPFYKSLLNQSKQSYFKRSLGDKMDLWVLDSGHLAHWGGRQKKWMKKSMESSSSELKIAAYHIPLYPSVRPFEKVEPRLGRKYWRSIFESMGIDLSFEHHDHAQKRTPYLRDNEVSTREEGGVLYLGDGCMGKKARTPAEDRWYLEMAQKEKHFWLVQYRPQEKRVDLKAINIEGEIIDEFHHEVRDDHEKL